VEREAHNLVLPEYVTTTEHDKKFTAAATLIEENFTVVLLADYGPPQHGMSAAAWRLLVLSRRLAEELLIALDLHRTVPFRVVEPTQADLDKLHELRLAGAVGHVRRRESAFLPSPSGSPYSSSHGQYFPADRTASPPKKPAVSSLLAAVFAEAGEAGGGGGGGKVRTVWDDDDDDDDDDDGNDTHQKLMSAIPQIAPAARPGAAGGGPASSSEDEQPRGPRQSKAPPGRRVRRVPQRSSGGAGGTGTGGSADEESDEADGQRLLSRPKQARSPVRTGSSRG